MPIQSENQMGKWGATSYIIGNIIGSGIFITPTSVLNNSTSIGVALIIWVVSGIIATLGAFCYVELGTSIHRSGGDFAYLCYVKWKPVAFAFMIMGCLFTYPATIAVQVETFAEYVIQGLHIEFCDKHSLFVTKKLIGFSLLLLILLLNMFSIRTVVARFQIVAMVAKFVATGIIIILGMYFLLVKGKTENLSDPFKNTTIDPAKIANAFFAGLFSYDGWDILNFGNEDMSNPRKAMSFAIIVGMSIVAFIYLTLNLSYFTVLTVPEIRSSSAVAMTFGNRALGSTFQYLMPFLVCIVLIGVINATLFMASRYIYAASRERHMPSFISCINRDHDSPRAALFIIVILIMAFSFLGNLEELISYVGFSHWIQRTITMVALLYIRFGNIEVHSQAIRLPIILPIIFMLMCGTLVAVTIVKDFSTAFVALLMLFLGILVYFGFIRGNSLKRFPAYRKILYKVNESTGFISQLLFNGEIELMDRNKKMDPKLKKRKIKTISSSVSNMDKPTNGEQFTTIPDRKTQ